MARKPVDVETLRHVGAKRRNIPTAELESVMAAEDKSPIRIAYERRNRDLDPQLVWRGKDEQDWSDLVVQAPPLYIQEKVHPKVLIDDLLRQSKERAKVATPDTPDLFADFNGLADKEAVTEFYAHQANWTNRMILGDSLQAMASLAEREGLRGKVQCIYLDPPYGIRFNSNFQWSTTSRDVKDGSKDHITREPEQVKAFRDTWRDGIHSYLTYLRDRLTVARDLLNESGSIFVQIGDENVHRVRAVMDEVFGDGNFVAQIAFQKTSSTSSEELSGVFDYILWFGRSGSTKYRALHQLKSPGDSGATQYTYGQDGSGARRTLSEWVAVGVAHDQLSIFSHDNITSQRPLQGEDVPEFSYEGNLFPVKKGTFKTDRIGLERLSKSKRMIFIGNTLRYVRFLDDFRIFPYSNLWTDTVTSGFADPKVYVVQTNKAAVERCVLMATDPGDLVLDPTCGSGTTAYVAEQWGRRWITIDTSRVALALARARIMGARYPYYLLADSPEGHKKELELRLGRSSPSLRRGGTDEAIQTGKAWIASPSARNDAMPARTHGDIRLGFVYERVPHITLKSIANNAEIDVIWEKWQEVLEPIRQRLNAALGRAAPSLRGGEADEAIQSGGSGLPRASGARNDDLAAWEEWEIPREADKVWPEEARKMHGRWWEGRIARQKAIDQSIAAKAEFEYLYDKPYPDNSKVRVAGPFTVESLSPHRVLSVDQDDELVDMLAASEGERAAAAHSSEDADFAQAMLDNLKVAGVQQAHKEGRISFTSIAGWPGNFICAEGRYLEVASAEGGKGDRPPAGQAAPAEPSPQATGVSAKEKRAGIFIGPEFGTVSRPDLVAAAREAADAGFDILIACAFNFDAHSAEFDKLGRIPVLKARMNPDLHMADELKSTGSGNLFVVFGEPDIDIEEAGGGNIQVRINGVDVFQPSTGEVKSDGPDGIACWFIDTDYNEESFFVRHAYFLGANDPYKALKTTLKAEVDEEAWQSLHSNVSRPFPKPKSGRIAVKVINHLGDEVMKVFGVE